jgi:hypothetical protein
MAFIFRTVSRIDQFRRCLQFNFPGSVVEWLTQRSTTLRNTAPYFHDDSAKTLSDVIEHYDFFRRRAGAQFGFPGFTAQDKADIVVFLELL